MMKMIQILPVFLLLAAYSATPIPDPIPDPKSSGKSFLFLTSPHKATSPRMAIHTLISAIATATADMGTVEEMVTVVIPAMVLTDMDSANGRDIASKTSAKLGMIASET
jgi:hypothetical protein